MKKDKTVCESKTQQTHLVRYKYLNGQGQLFGGVLMQWIDEMAGIVAMRHWGGSVNTAVVDSLVFKKPAFLNEIVVITGQITYVGKTSMEVRVDTNVESLTGNKNLINRAYIVMVGLDEKGKPACVPGLTLETDEEKQEWEMGQKRYELRKSRRKEKY